MLRILRIFINNRILDICDLPPFIYCEPHVVKHEHHGQQLPMAERFARLAFKRNVAGSSPIDCNIFVVVFFKTECGQKCLITALHLLSLYLN